MLKTVQRPYYGLRDINQATTDKSIFITKKLKGDENVAQMGDTKT
jgi:hypothetical protein